VETITVTRISQTKRGRFALFCGEEFLFSVDSETFFAERLAEGREFEPAELDELRAKSDTRKAKDKALQYLSLRDYASGELYDKLCLKFDPHSAAAAVAKMGELGLLNDEAFARHRAKYLLGQNKSRSQIARHLAEKGVDRATVDEVLAEFYEDAVCGGEELPPDAAAALRLVEKSYGRRLAEGKRENVLAALARRGFSLRDARAAIERWQQENPGEGE